jgi:hypothetical protein
LYKSKQALKNIWNPMPGAKLGRIGQPAKKWESSNL